MDVDAAPRPLRAHARVAGHVQGVGFRYAVAEAARRQNLSGWVRNLPSGDVEAVFEGPRAAVDTVLAWCREGPPGAWVRDLRLDLSEPLEGLRGFEIRRTPDV